MPPRTRRKIVIWIALLAATSALAVWGASHLPGRFGAAGICTVLAGAAFVALYFLDMTVPGVNVFSKAVVRLPKGGNCVALTFDDGPVEPFTRQILDVLDRFNAKATFFCLGENVERSPDLAREIVLRGHALGNHSFSHRLLPSLKGADVSREIESTAQLMERLTGARPKLFRCPKGYKSRSVARRVARAGHTLIGFSYPIYDVENPDASILAERVLVRLRAGDIVLMHDGFSTRKPGSRDQLVKALPMILEGIRARGITPVALS
ncbi:MAG: polysaccharide deacetylase family protein [Pseudomonadota bacterium]